MKKREEGGGHLSCRVGRGRAEWRLEEDGKRWRISVGSLQDVVEGLMKARKFDAASGRIEEAGEEALSPQLWVARGRCIQLGEGKGAPLEEAKKSFRRALELDGRCLEAWIELGYYVLCVEDDAREAYGIFRKAAEVLDDFGGEIEKGIRMCEEKSR